MDSNLYAVYFEGLGYYAKYQPNYDWSFTLDLDKALLYKTRGKALARSEWGKQLNHKRYLKSKIVEIRQSISIVE
jgi:hypothetical protein